MQFSSSYANGLVRLGVSEEIACVRGVPAHQNCLSPRGHSAFSTPIEMLEFAARMRELSGGKPVG